MTKLIKMKKTATLIFFLSLSYFEVYTNSRVWIEAEQFKNKGGWIVDPQFIDQMGSAYLLAHGLGEPVHPAKTGVNFPDKGNYHLWIRTIDWAPYPKGPGKFQVEINQQTVPTVFGANGIGEWHWQYGGEIFVHDINVEIKIIDLTGFAGRIDAIYFSNKKNDVPPNKPKELANFRRKMLNIPEEPVDSGRFDLVVVGGGIAGICVAIQAARLGLKVALIENRPILGGNNSSETRIPMSGDIYSNLYPKLGRIVRELDTGYRGQIGRIEQYGDERKLETVENEENISLFLSTHVYDVERSGNRIISALGRNVISSQEYRFVAPYFVDCTGDGSLGYFAGAEYRMGRESFEETSEPKAPITSDGMTLGATNHWYAELKDYPSDFPLTPWAVQFQDEYYLQNVRGAWYWESGFYKDMIRDAEAIRDYNFRVIYGHWSYLKNQKRDIYSNWKLSWMAFILGKRESRRLVGDIVISELDINYRVDYPDAIVTTTWGIDLHYPDPKNSNYYPNEEFLAIADHDRDFEPYHIPYRCFYSKNIYNLFMAGRNISVTHIALGTVRVMRTTGMMGEAVGLAAYIAVKNNCTPREVYTEYLSDLIDLLTNGYN